MTIDKGVIFLLCLQDLKPGTEHTRNRGKLYLPCIGAVDSMPAICFKLLECL